MYQVLLVIFLLVAISLVLLIILQHSPGMGYSFGSGSSLSLFRSSRISNVMTRMTAILATLFFIINLFLCNLSSHQRQKNSQWDNLYKDKKTYKVPSTIPSNV